MAEENDTEQDDKTEEPTQRKIDEARKQGDVIRSQDVSSLFVLVATAIIAIALAGPMSVGLGPTLARFLESPHELATDPGGLQAIAAGLMGRVGLVCAAAFAILALAGLLGTAVQDKVVFTAKRIEPKLSKISPLAGFKRLFGGQAWLQFGKNVLKMAAVGCAVAIVIVPRLAELALWPTMDVSAWGGALIDLVRDVLVATLIVVAMIAALDYVLARRDFMQRLRMTKQEVKQEFRESEGDPQLKAKVRQIRMERASRRMMQAVPNATVVIMNPTHYAVALQYEPGESAAPVCVAKGLDEVALRIRAVAEEHGVAVVEDPPLARALHAASELDQPIPRAHWEAAAKVISFVLRNARNKGTSAPRRSPTTPESDDSDD
jgi:flagellar biosynthesis protein FlhB